MRRVKLASAIRGIAVRGNQQRFVVVRLFGINTEAQYHNIQKGRFWQLHTAGAVVIAGTELHLVDPGAVIITLQQRRVATTVAVGQGRGNQFQL